MDENIRRIIPGTIAVLGVIVTQPSYGDTSPTQSQVSSDGGTVKSGDVIIWKVNKAVTLQAPASSATSTTASTKATAGATATGGDIAAAAAAVKAAADKLVKPSPSLPAGQSPSEAEKAASAADDQAAAAVVKANSDAFLAGASKTSTSAGTALALAQIVSAAKSSRDTLEGAATTAAAAAAADQTAATAAKSADKPGAAASVHQAALAAAAKANTSNAASQSAATTFAVAEAYLAAATNALTLAITASPTADKSATTVQDDGKRCFPSDSLFQVTNVVAASTTTAAAAAGSTPSNTQLVSGYFSSKSGWSSLHFRHPDSLPFSRHAPGGEAPEDMVSPCGADVPYAAYDKTYDFSADQLSKQDFWRLGFTWGVLVIPYKFYFTDRSVKSNSSTVAFAGYEGWIPGVSLSAVAALGPGLTTNSTTPSSASSTTPAASSSKTTTSVTYTAAVGLIMAFGDSKTVKAGLLIGRDYQGNDSGFQYQNKTWMALSIGAGF